MWALGLGLVRGKGGVGSMDQGGRMWIGLAWTYWWGGQGDRYGRGIVIEGISGVMDWWIGGWCGEGKGIGVGVASGLVRDLAA